MNRCPHCGVELSEAENTMDQTDDRSMSDPMELSESVAGEEARWQWARAYDDLNGAPEGDWDR